MNYRHAYHAGNFADVHKHATLGLMIEHLTRKEAAFAYLDTHAGLGLYDLTSVQAEKTGEWQAGIARVMAAPNPPPSAAPLLRVVRTLNPDGALRFYPGSPAVVATLSRPQDRLTLCELHPEDAADLRRRFAADARAGVHHRDGYDGIKALVPPPERRGLVLVDPPFEKPGEFERMRRGLAQGLKRWSTGIYALWYPIKDREPVARFHADLSMMGLKSAFAAELMIKPGDNPQTLNGCGLVVVNPPWQLDIAMAELLPWLAEALAPGIGSWRVEPLTLP
ncbi:Ribosomal RNA large subunit methyltransferase J [Magnetospirillum sp. LM-5]|uniref:23S rRNA (adenine(2030)-N(6))-methyltransferase RlmJ n=1 Tax=Magnetospirillum sp. LM-5 TaxID=2681466 RepID=UPI001382F625|nr:23S rRNA (adenine(2030)-N(6))-methyltransferase RlmJ [Magnetospirillum sp. LM-5]CAA7621560.1 Ribosomal RNA large subunit methyltransferase J [Magnetospirillum sp. LM-5]